MQNAMAAAVRNPRRGQPIKDITGQKFGRLTAEYPTDRRDSKGYVIWHCRCDCGNELDVTYNALLYSEMKSCGCRKKEHDQKLRTFLTHVDGTSLDMLKSRKLPANNSTGVKGVYRMRGKYVAKIVFQKKQHLLGAYDTLEEAAAVRKETEERLSDAVASHYDQWKKRAEADQVWAARHPVQFFAEKDQSGQLQIQCLPELEE